MKSPGGASVIWGSMSISEQKYQLSLQSKCAMSSIRNLSLPPSKRKPKPKKQKRAERSELPFPNRPPIDDVEALTGQTLPEWHAPPGFLLHSRLNPEEPYFTVPFPIAQRRTKGHPTRARRAKNDLYPKRNRGKKQNGENKPTRSLGLRLIQSSHQSYPSRASMCVRMSQVSSHVCH